MRIMLIVAWLFIGLGGLIYHYGPGQEKLEADRVGVKLRLARLSAETNQFTDAVKLYEEAMSELPGESISECRYISLEKAKAQMMNAELPEAREALQDLLTEARADENADPKFIADVQATLANSQYYMTWLMRLEGMPEDQWMPEIESARQHYAQVATDAENAGNEKLLKNSLEDLESTIRLARMDLSELQGLPLPNQ